MVSTRPPAHPSLIMSASRQQVRAYLLVFLLHSRLHHTPTKMLSIAQKYGCVSPWPYASGEQLGTVGQSHSVTERLPCWLLSACIAAPAKAQSSRWRRRLRRCVSATHTWAVALGSRSCPALGFLRILGINKWTLCLFNFLFLVFSLSA